MNADELPEELRPYAQTLEIFGWNRFIPRYKSATPKQQENWRKVIWRASQSIENLAKDEGIDRDCAADLFRLISDPTWNPSQNSDSSSN